MVWMPNASARFFGITAQRYSLVMYGNSQQLKIEPWEPETQRSAVVPFTWKADTWYHITLSFHRTPGDNYEHYDSLMIAQFNRNGRIAGSHLYNWNLAFASSALPAGWGEDLGLQFQMDIASAGASMTEYVDGVTLRAW